MRVVAAVLLLVSVLHAGIWGVLRDKEPAPDFKGLLPSVSYAPFEGSAHPDIDNIPTVEKIRADLKTLSTMTRAIRLYSSTGGVELVPPIAAEFGIKVTVGAWIDKDKDRNDREIKAAIELARKNSNVVGVVVGNEVIYRGEQKVEDLIDMIKKVKGSVRVPVTTGEIWNIWRDNPELGSSVDFIAAHVLPYWENFRSDQAVDQAVDRYNLLRNQFPGKRIVIAEFGWPSAGYNLRNADPGPFQQALTLRNFVSRAEALGMDYNIVEAIDQPWKYFEGGVGPYWGILNASREPKFAWTGPVENPDYWKLMGIALLVGILLSLPILRIEKPTAKQAFLLSATANGVGAWAATVFAFWNGHYFIFGSAFALTLGMILLVPLVLIAMARIDEIAAVAFGRPPQRLITKDKPVENVPEAYCPKVSIHIPAYFEPVDMLKQTLDALSRLNYPNYECVVIINNTPDPAFWQPIQDHCRALGERFKFINAEKVQGFKAGALRIAMDRTAVDAEIIGILDADYVVEPDWLKDLVPAFADPRVGLVQAPQEHRDGDLSIMHYIMNGEYAGFFDIGMVQRNELNAVIVHGTMCLIRRAAMDMAGGWSSDTICEDSDLGLAIQEPRLDHALHQHPLRRGPAARHLRGLQEAAAPLGLWRPADRQEALAPLPARREPADRRPEARIRPRLAELAGRRKPRRRRGAAQPRLGADRRLRRHRHPRQDPDVADHRRLRRLAGALPVDVPRPRRHQARPDARCHDRRDERAMDGVARGGPRPDHRAHRLRPHLQGRPQPHVDRVPGVLGGRDRRPLADRLRRPDRLEQLPPDHRDLHLRRRPGAAEPAVPGRRRDRHPRAEPDQLVPVLARQRDPHRRADRPAPRRPATGGRTAARAERGAAGDEVIEPRGPRD